VRGATRAAGGTTKAGMKQPRAAADRRQNVDFESHGKHHVVALFSFFFFFYVLFFFFFFPFFFFFFFPFSLIYDKLSSRD